MTLAECFGRRLRFLRRQHGFTQQRLAEASGLTRRAVQYIERGERTAKIDTLLALAAALDLDPGVLLRGIRIS
jgi:transcriptional regulator with XRE-family HTH domain